MFSIRQKREIADRVQKILRETKHERIRKQDPDLRWRNGIPREIIDWQRMPADDSDLPEYLRLTERWIAAALPRAHFEVTKWRIDGEDSRK